MTLRKITIDNNSVEGIAQNEQIQERYSKPKTIKGTSLPGKQKSIFHRTKKIIKKIAAE